MASVGHENVINSSAYATGWGITEYYYSDIILLFKSSKQPGREIPVCVYIVPS